MASIKALGDYAICRIAFLSTLLFLINSPICPAQDRAIEIHQPGYELPLKVTDVKNLQTELWHRDLEIEVENVSSRPIYYIQLLILVPDLVDQAGIPYGASLEYGSSRLAREGVHAVTKDVPIAPGEKYVFRLRKSKEANWTGFLGHLDVLPEGATRKLLLRIQTISFGDGTGFKAGGIPYPSPKQ
jgi:hypothetical protein